MTDALRIGWGAVSIAGLACVGYWAWLVVWRPARALDCLWGYSADLPWHVRPTAFCAVATLAVLYYCGFASLLAWMPGSWGWMSQDDGGSWSYISLRGFVTLALTIAGLALTIAAVEPMATARAKASE